jgi:hypothetical protein
MNREQEICLAKIYDNFPEEVIKVEFLDVLTINVFEELKTSISEIEELHNVRRLRDFVVGNDEEIINYLDSTLQELLHKSISWNSTKREDSEKVYLNANRLFLNYLSSVRTFLDHSETFLNKKFGSKSAQFLEFKKMLTAFYDHSFAYRFFYKLRNYAQHIGLPLDSVGFSTEYDRSNNTMKGTLLVTFNSDKLLLNYDGWGTVKSELQQIKEDFDLAPLVFEMTHNIIEIERNIELLHKDELIKAANYITKLIKHLQNNSGEIVVAYDFKVKENGELLKYQLLHIPFDTIEYIQRELIK